MVSGCLAKVVFSDIRHNFLSHYLLAAGFIIITPVIFGISELNEYLAAQPLEMISSAIGIITLTPVFMPEQDKDIYDLVRSKKTSHELVCIFRVICSVLIILLLDGILAAMMKASNSYVTPRLYTSAVSGAVMAGSSGAFTSALNNNTITGYMVSVSYFLSAMFLRRKLKIFDLFTFSDGNTKVNPWLFAFSLILITAALLIRKCTAKR